MSSVSWRGVPLSEIIGSQSPWGAPEFPLVSPSRHHAVLYHIPSSGDTGDRPLKPQVGQDKWDGEHVRMPCSSKSLYPVEDNDGNTHLKKRWGMIEEALRRPIMTSQQLAETITSYNTKFKSSWHFTALHTLFNDHLEEEESKYFFTMTLPEIAKLALDLPKLIQAPIPLLKQHSNKSISLTQHQVASLLANAFFCTFPRRNTTKRASEYETYPHINFSSLYEAYPSEDVLEKLKCVCHYFRRVCTKPSTGVVTFSRRSVPLRECPKWPSSSEQIATLPIHVDSEAMIEDADGLLQLDFANKYLGGGVLGRGSVQEEIRFAICPELMASMLFTEVLRPNEALMMIGCERYSQHTGYGRTLRWSGDYRDNTPLDSSCRRRVAVLAIDALPYYNGEAEFHRDHLTRELNKAWIGFTFFTDKQSKSLQYPGIATGNWGCGAFGGTPQLKSLIQLLACVEARRPMAYFTFEDTEIRDEIINIYNLLARYNVTVGQLYQYIVRFSKTDVRKGQLHAFLHQLILDENQTSSPKTHIMSTSSPETGQPTEKQKQPNDSPDLFSQDELDTQEDTVTNNDKTLENPCKIPKMFSKHKMADSREKMADSREKMADDKDKMDTRIFDELLDDDSGKNLKDSTSLTSKYFDKQDNKSVDHKMADEENKMATSSNSKPTRKSLFEEMQKLDEDYDGRSNLSSTNPLSLCETKIVIPPSDTSMDCEVQASPEVKKKMAKKITDYFTKKS